MRLFIIILLIIPMTGCSILSIINDLDGYIISAEVKNVVQFDFGMWWWKVSLIKVTFNDIDPMVFVSEKAFTFYPSETNSIFYTKIPEKIEVPIIKSVGLEIPTIVQYQIWGVSRGGG